MKLFRKDKIVQEQHRTIIYEIYDYLKGNAVGYENRIKSNKLMEEFGIATNDTLRSSSVICSGY